MISIRNRKWLFSVLAFVLVFQLSFGMPGVFKSEVFADKGGKNKLDIPENIQVSATVGAISVKWDEVKKADSYEIQINDELVENIEDCSYTFEGLTSDTEYTLRVRAVDKKSKSEWSQEIQIRTVINEGEQADEEKPNDESTPGESIEDENIPDEGTEDENSPSEDTEDENAQDEDTVEDTTNPEENSDQPLGVPENINADCTDASIKIAWDAVEGAESYDIKLGAGIEEGITVTEYVYGNLEPATEYQFEIRAVNSTGKGEWSETLICTTKPLVSEESGNGNGLLGEYYNDINFKELVFTRIDPEINFNWGFKSPDPKIDKKTFSVRWTGQIQPEYTGKYTLYANVNNGVRLWINGKLIIDEWRFLFPKESKGTITLTAGEKYDIKMEYQEGLGKAKAILSWSCIEQKKQVIPQTQLYCSPKAPDGITAVPFATSIALKWNEVSGADSYDIRINDETITEVNENEYEFSNLTPGTEYTFKIRSVSSYGTSEWSKAVTVSTLEEQSAVLGNGNGLTGEYYDNIIFKKLIFKRVDEQIDFDWGNGSPDPKLKKNTFSIKWTGKILPKYTAKHTIYLYSDDGAKLSINGREIIDYWKPHASKEGSATIDLVAGEKCDVEIEYFNINKEAKVALYWSSPYESKAIIPMEQMYTTPGIPANINSTAEGSQITLNWENTPGAESYQVEADGVVIDNVMYMEYVHEVLPNTEHKYRIRAVNEVGKGEWTETFTKTSAPGIPTNVKMEATDTAISINWDSVEAAEAYEIETDGKIVENGNSTSYTHSSLIPNTEHNYRIRSVNSNGTGEWSGAYSRYTLPDTPKNFMTSITSNTITINWDAIPGVLSYEIETDNEINNTGLETTYTHRNLRPNTEHIYRVRAIGPGGTGYWSNEIIASTMLAVPQNIAAKATSSTIALTWDSVVDAQYYDMEADGNIIDNGGSTEFTHSDLIPNTEHIYRVRAREDLGAGDWSEQLKIKTLLETPSNIRAEATDNSITITWNAVIGATRYDVELSGVRTITVSEPECVIDGLNSSTEYSYRVLARCEGNESEPSSEESIITLPDIPSSITVKSSSTTNTITWDKVHGATSYEIEADGELIGNGIQIVYTHENLGPDSRHTYRVRAIGPGGTGCWSELITKTTAPHVPVNIEMLSTSTVTTVKWGAVAEAEYYEIEVDDKLLDNGSSTEYVHSNIGSNSIHSYRIRAINQNGIGDWSTVLLKTTAPHIPSNIVFESASTLTEVKWDTVEEAEKYEIEVDGVVLDNGLNALYMHGVLEPDSQHKYRIRAINSNGIGDWSKLLLKTTAPHIPVNLSAISTSITNTLNWDLVEEAESYEVEADGEFIISTIDNTCTHKDLNPDSEHSYRVRAVNANGKGDWSELLSKTTAPHVPVNISAFSSSTKIKFTWEEVYETQYYEVEIDNELLTNMTETSYLCSGLIPNTEHKFRIRAVNVNGTGDWSELIYKYTAPDIPVNLSAVSTSNSITITWDAIEAAAGYDIEINGTAVDVGNSTTYTQAGLNPNTQRAYKVRAKNSNGIGDWSRAIAKITLLDIPSNIIAEAAETAITLGWDSVAGADQYDIMINSSVMDSTTVTEYVYRELTPNTEYSFNIRAKNAEGAGDWSETINKTTMFGAPQGFNALAAETSIVLTWQPLSDGTAYEIEVDGATIDNGAETSYIHQALMADTQHTYRVRAKTDNSVSRWSEILYVYTLPMVPANLRIAASSNGIDVAWDMAAGVMGYELEADGTIIELGLANTYQHLNLTPNSTHTYRVRAIAGGGRSAWSEEVSIATLLGIPQNIVTVVTNSSTTLNWDAVEGALSYEVDADGIVASVTDGTSYTHAGLNANTVHVYRIRAKEGEFSGEWSTPVTALTMLNIPANIKAMPTANTITLTWDAVADAENYEVEVNGAVVNDIKETMYKSVGLTSNTEYIIRVKAKNEMNTSDWSTNINQYTAPDVPQNIKAASTIDSTTVVWDAVYGAVGYDIEIDGVVIDLGGQTTYTNAGLTPNTQHVYCVRSKNANVAGEWSIPLTETTLPEMTISCAADESFNFMVVAPKKADVNLRTITVTYNPDELEVLDIYAATLGADLTEGKIQGTDVTVTQFIPGKIVLTIENATKTIMSITKFKAKTNLNSNISYEIE